MSNPTILTPEVRRHFGLGDDHEHGPRRDQPGDERLIQLVEFGANGEAVARGDESAETERGDRPTQPR